ncbi:TnsD family Tn7-like transposition protein [Azospira sp. I09]|jgi:hypothetical protein|uniref:TnsD family Tn7-like transposition protein n=1 Tax=Azospira sp. I09 TaxID=1765049 RepID=UPI0012605A6D|nr:TnsD family Tn7-like transposition protein [Azospira sp. I09]
MTTVSSSLPLSTVSTGGVCLHPYHYPDETHSSQAGRYHAHSANSTTSITFRELYGCKPFRTTHVVPANLEQWAIRQTGDAAQILAHSLRETTLFPLFEVFNSIKIDLTPDIAGLAKQIQQLPKRIVGQSADIRLCWDCLQEDLATHGEPYIHRSHQIPGVTVCWKHSTELLVTCPHCKCPFEHPLKADLITHLWKPCVCGHFIAQEAPCSVKATDERQVRYALFAHQLLNAATTEISSEVLSSIYRWRIQELGLNQKSKVNQQRLMTELEKHYGSTILSEIDFAYAGRRLCNWLGTCLSTRAQEAPLQRHLLLAQFLFGNKEGFWKVHDLIVAMPEQERPRALRRLKIKGSGTSISGAAEKLSKGQLGLLKHRQEHPNWCLEDYWRERPGLIAQVLRKDSEQGLAWINRIFGIATAPETSCEAPQVSPDDAILAERIKAAADSHYQSTQWPRKLSRNGLLHTIGWKGGKSASPKKYPKAIAMLQACAESSWHFYARRILWSIFHFRDSRPPAYKVVQFSKIEDNRGKDLVALFRELVPSGELQRNQIVSILTAYGISKDWEGLPPKDSYYITGRRYFRRTALPHSL